MSTSLQGLKQSRGSHGHMIACCYAEGGRETLDNANRRAPPLLIMEVRQVT